MRDVSKTTEEKGSTSSFHAYTHKCDFGYTHVEKRKSETVSLAVHSSAPFGGGSRFSTNSCVSRSANGNSRNIGSKTAGIVATVVTPLPCLSSYTKDSPMELSYAMFQGSFFKPGIIIMAAFHKKAAGTRGDHPFPNCIASNKVISDL